MDEFSGVFEAVENQLNDKVKLATANQIKKIELVASEKITEIDNMLSTGQKLTVVTGKGAGVVEGLKHRQLKDLIQMVGQGLPVLMVGMAGTGKTHAASQVAKALKRDFYAMSVGAQTSKSDILGYMHAGGGYVSTLFRKAYENGGVFLMDELDAGNANVLIQVNSALSNNYCAFPDGMVERHKGFSFIATANTYGNGANRIYVGRNQLDAATLDRFTTLTWQVDENLEGHMVKEYANGERWHTVVKHLRDYVEKQGMRTLVTPRATLRGSILLEAGFGFQDTLEGAILNAFTSDKHTVVSSEALKIWGKEPIKSSAERNKDLIEAVNEQPTAKEIQDTLIDLEDVPV